MIRRWPGQTKEEWLKEYHRDKALTPEEREKELKDFVADIKKKDEERKLEKQEQTQKQTDFFENCDHPNSLENDEATILWIVVMAIATIFKGNWLIWIVATIIWRRYITRHKRKK
jgi:hypothetical protein